MRVIRDRLPLDFHLSYEAKLLAIALAMFALVALILACEALK